MPNVAQDPIMDDLRARITAADADIVAAVNRRAALVAELHAHKRTQGYEVFDPAREEQVVTAVLRANRGPLSDDALRELYGVILPLCTREAASA
jgi:3-deoxy-7-phosphoheptulonate synthase/chorismate mutase